VSHRPYGRRDREKGRPERRVETGEGAYLFRTIRNNGAQRGEGK